jgi:hypothetical protein
MNKDHYIGKIRCFLHKTDTYSFEEFRTVEVFDDYLITDIGENQADRILEEELSNIGLDGFEDSIKEILKAYSVDDYIEVVADVYIHYFSIEWFGCGTEYDAQMWFEDAKHRKLTEEQITRFVEQ